MQGTITTMAPFSFLSAKYLNSRITINNFTHIIQIKNAFKSITDGCTGWFKLLGGYSPQHLHPRFNFK